MQKSAAGCPDALRRRIRGTAAGLLLSGGLAAQNLPAPDSFLEWHCVVPPRARGSNGAAYDPLRRVGVVAPGQCDLEPRPHEVWEWSGGELRVKESALMPAARSGAVLCHAPSIGGVVRFGGSGQSPTNEFLVWNGTDWVRIPAAQLPPPRDFAALAYDLRRQRLVLFGGWDGTVLTDTWEWDRFVWRKLNPAQAPPGSTQPAAMVYDSRRGRCVWVGNGQTWEWDGGNWTRATPALEPPNRIRPGFAYDSKRGVMLLFGGLASIELDDLWEYDGVRWTQRWTSLRPPRRDTPYAWFDTEAGEFFVGGGSDRANQKPGRRDLWSWDGQRWQQILFEPAIGAITNALMVHDSVRDELVLHGGFLDGAGGTRAVDTWIRRNGNWIMHRPPVDLGPVVAMTFDPHRGRTVLLTGGWYGPSKHWEWDGTAWSQRMIATPVANTSTPMVYDERRRRMVMLVITQAAVTQLWEFDGAQWVQRTYSAGPTNVAQPGGAYDPVLDRTVLFGGGNAAGYLDQTWTWDGAVWQQIAHGPRPAARALANMYFDRHRNRIVMFGGNDRTWFLWDHWELDGESWHPRGVLPLPRPQHPWTATAYDGRRAILHSVGGSHLRNGPATTSSEMWELHLHGGPTGPGEPTSGQWLRAEHPAYLGGSLSVRFRNDNGWSLLGYAPGLPTLPGLVVQGPGLCSPLRLYPDLAQANWLPVTTNPGHASFAIPQLPGLQDVSVCLQAIATSTPTNCLTATNGLAVVLRAR